MPMPGGSASWRRWSRSRCSIPSRPHVDWRMSRGHRLGDVKLPVTMSSIEAAGEIWPELLQRCARLTSG